MKTLTPTQGPRTGPNIQNRSYPNSIRYYRLRANLKLTQVAEQLDVTPQAIHRVETRGVGLTRRYWYLLADLFGCHPRDLEEPRDTLPDFKREA